MAGWSQFTELTLRILLLRAAQLMEPDFLVFFFVWTVARIGTTCPTVHHPNTDGRARDEPRQD